MAVYIEKYKTTGFIVGLFNYFSQKRKREQFEFGENTSTLNLEHRICGFFTLEEKPNFGDVRELHAVPEIR